MPKLENIIFALFILSGLFAVFGFGHLILKHF